MTSVAAQEAVERRYAEMSFAEKGERVRAVTLAALSRPAAVSRIQRLRARLIESALRFGEALDRDDRAELMRFLRRTGARRLRRFPIRTRATMKRDADDELEALIDCGHGCGCAGSLSHPQNPRNPRYLES